MVLKPPPAPWGNYANGSWHTMDPAVDHPGQTKAQAVKAVRAWATRTMHVASISAPAKAGPDAPWMLRITKRVSAGVDVPEQPAPRPLGSTVPLVRHVGDPIDLSPAQRGAEAYRLHCRAVDWNTIALELRYRTVAEAQRAAADHVATMGTPDRAVSTAAMIDQLDRALYRSLEVLDADHVKLFKGRVVTVLKDPENPDAGEVPLLDSGPTLAAASTIKGLLTTKAELLGLNAPTQHEHTLVPLPPTVATWVESKRLDRPEV